MSILNLSSFGSPYVQAGLAAAEMFGIDSSSLLSITYKRKGFNCFPPLICIADVVEYIQLILLFHLSSPTSLGQSLSHIGTGTVMGPWYNNYRK